MEEDVLWMRYALQEAKKAYELGEVPIGAVLVYEERIIARGYNQVESLRDATAHAEMICLTAGSEALANWRLLGTTLYVTVEPCIMCAGALFLARVKRVVWGAKDIRHGACGSLCNIFQVKHPMHAIEIHSGILEEESALLLRTFFQEQRLKKNSLKE